jgi:hypothetical protein
VVTSRAHPALLGHKATLGASGEPLVDGRLWTDPRVLADVRRIAGPESRDNSLARFDMAPLLVATDGALVAQADSLRPMVNRPSMTCAGVV